MLPFQLACPLKGLLSLGFAAPHLGPNEHLRQLLVPQQGQLLLLLVDLEQDTLPDESLLCRHMIPPRVLAPSASHWLSPIREPTKV